CSIALADIRITQGRLRDAVNIFEQALELASRDTGSVPRGTADMYVGLSRIAWERNDLGATTRYLRRSEALGEQAELPQNAYRWLVAMAQVREAEGDLLGARDLLDEALRVYVSDFSPDVRPVGALKARVLLAQGHTSEALDWAHRQHLSTE